MKDHHFKFSASVILLPFLFVLSLWFVFWVGINFHLNFETYGIYPRTFFGLRGIVFSPFIHGNMEHLYNNSIPLLILLAALRFFYREQTFLILGYGILFSGFITWIIGRDSYHIGASGLVYVLVGFIFFKGIMTQYYRLVALSMVVVLVYGSLVWYVFPDVDKGISWEGHLGGLIAGFVFAVAFKTPEYKKMALYDWEQPNFNPQEDKFLQRFDENGNFVNLPLIEEPVIEIASEDALLSIPNVTVVYDFVPTKNDVNETNELKPES